MQLLMWMQRGMFIVSLSFKELGTIAQSGYGLFNASEGIHTVPGVREVY